MKQTIVAWLCLAAIVVTNSGCPNPHTADRVDNATTAAAYQVALEVCVNNGLNTIEATNDYEKADREFRECVAAADEKYGRTWD